MRINNLNIISFSMIKLIYMTWKTRLYFKLHAKSVGLRPIIIDLRMIYMLGMMS